MENIYDFVVEKNTGETYKLEDYKDYVMLIVNTASECGFTPQFEGLQKLYEKYKDQKFIILGFPCNQFGKQAPGSIEDINKFCVDKFITTFPRFQKVNVNGEDESILFTYLKRHEKGFINRKIKWNFTKFLVDQNGRVIKRYSPRIKPEKIAKDIEKLLQENKQ